MSRTPRLAVGGLIRLVTGGSWWARHLAARRVLALLAVGAGVLAASACTSSGAEGGDAWTAAYASSADRVWTAVHQSLDELGYEVEEESRHEGTVRAAQIAGRAYEGVVLRISQVQRTEVVRVHVQPSGGASTGLPDGHRLRDAAVREFLAELDRRLGRHLED